LWDYLYEDDAAEAIVRLVHAPDFRGVCDVASGEKITLGSVILTARAMINPSLNVTFGNRVDHGMVSDCKRMEQELRWRPTVSLPAGIAATIEAVRSEMIP
jgi:nucleoside-diphosphate-sugar epimerase